MIRPGRRFSCRIERMRALVLVPRGFHLGHAGCYGNDWIATPALDRLAAEGVVFDQHFADRPDLEGACRAWRSGTYHFPPLPGEQPPPPPEQPDLLALLRAHGVVISLVTDAGRPVPAEFAAGWDSVRRVAAGDEETALERTLEATLAAVEELAGVPHWLLWVDLAVLLPPWHVPDDLQDAYLEEQPCDEEEEDEEEAELLEQREPLEPLLDPAPGAIDPHDDATFLRLQGSYAAAVTHLDRGLDVLLEELRRRQVLDDLLLVLSSDHGLPLGEHGVVGPCRPWLHDELIHLPLIVRRPGGAAAGRRVAALTQTVDLMPTLLEAFGVAAPPVHGRSLWPLLHGAPQQARPYACSGLLLGGDAELALRSPPWAFLLRLGGAEGTRQPQLYVKPDDRWEVNDVRQHHLELCEHFEQVLRGFVAATRRPGPVQPPELRDEEALLAAEANNQPDTVSEGSQS
jgi:Sulfatase